jgi:hypothetical protein
VKTWKEWPAVFTDEQRREYERIVERRRPHMAITDTIRAQAVECVLADAGLAHLLDRGGEGGPEKMTKKKRNAAGKDRRGLHLVTRPPRRRRYEIFTIRDETLAELGVHAGDEVVVVCGIFRAGRYHAFEMGDGRVRVARADAIMPGMIGFVLELPF